MMLMDKLSICIDLKFIFYIFNMKQEVFLHVPTSWGKTYGHLMTALYYAGLLNKSCIIATTNLTMVDQIYEECMFFY